MISRNTRQKIEYGDFQTPDLLTAEICSFLADTGNAPQCIVEPTCGTGGFLIQSAKAFPACRRFYGLEINRTYLKILEKKISEKFAGDQEVHLQEQDFFTIDWPGFFASLPQPFLILGNPPWVTNTVLGTIESDNLPRKSNFQNRNGFDAISGKSNFDISEWMLIRLISAMQSCRGTLAMLCKTSVARKVLRHSWLQGYFLKDCSLYRIDAKKYFNVNVDACLLVCETDQKRHEGSCSVYKGLSRELKQSVFGLHGSELVANMDQYSKLSFLDGSSDYIWRSGIKHDCSQVMEFEIKDNHFVNGLGESCGIEPEMLFPLYKSSDVFHRYRTARKYVLVTQKQVGQDTIWIQRDAPKTWKYLTQHAALLDKRKSRIYRKNPRFSIFGIGNYSFAPWKIAISGLYKKIQFSLISPNADGKPCMVDDTCYFVPCWDIREAQLLQDLLALDEAKAFLEAFIFWDSKRPITAEVLRRINLRALAQIAQKENLYQELNEARSRQMIFSF